MPRYEPIFQLLPHTHTQKAPASIHTANFSRIFYGLCVRAGWRAAAAVKLPRLDRPTARRHALGHKTMGPDNRLLILRLDSNNNDDDLHDFVTGSSPFSMNQRNACQKYGEGAKPRHANRRFSLSCPMFAQCFSLLLPFNHPHFSYIYTKLGET